MTEKKNQLYFLIAIISFFVSSATALLLPFALFEGAEQQRSIAYSLGAVFWVGLIIGIFSMLLIDKNRKKKRQRNSLPFIRFFRNKEALVFDSMFIISIVGVVILLFTRGVNQWLSSTIIFMFLFSLEMHCIFNGENYQYIKFLNKKSKGRF